MKIAVFGTGVVGETLGSRLVELGHEVVMGSRTADNAKGKAWVAKAGPRASLGTFATAAKGAELVFNCTLGAASVDALKAAGEGALDGKIIVDVANPLDFSKGMPPSLFISNTDSLGELIQRTFPKAQVVKTLNTMWCGLMANPRMIKESHLVYLAGNDENAKAKVRGLLEAFGWRHEEMLDLGDLSAARATESVLPIWLRIYGAKKTGVFNFSLATPK